MGRHRYAALARSADGAVPTFGHYAMWGLGPALGSVTEAASGVASLVHSVTTGS